MGAFVQLQCNVVILGVLFVVSERLFGFRSHRDLLRPCRGCSDAFNGIASAFQNTPDPEVAVGVSVLCMFIVFNLLVTTSTEKPNLSAGPPVSTGTNAAQPASARAKVPSKPASPFESWLSSLSLEEVHGLAVKHTIFFEVRLDRQTPQEPWGFEVEKGDARSWTISKIAPGSAADRAVSPAAYFKSKINHEVLAEDSTTAKSAQETSTPLKLEIGDLILGLNTTVAYQAFPDEMKRAQNQQSLKMAIVRTVYWAKSDSVPNGVVDEKACACFAAILSHLETRLLESGGKVVALTSRVPERSETRASTNFILNQHDSGALESFRIPDDSGDATKVRYRLGMEVVKASVHFDGRESLYVKTIDEGGIMYRFCNIRNGDYIDAINGTSTNLVEALRQFSCTMKPGTQFEVRRAETPGLQLAKQQGYVVDGAVNCAAPVLPFAFDLEGRVLGADPSHSLSFGDRMVVVNQKRGFLQMAIEYVQALADRRFYTEASPGGGGTSILVPSQIVSGVEWDALTMECLRQEATLDTPHGIFKQQLQEDMQRKRKLKEALSKYKLSGASETPANWQASAGDAPGKSGDVDVAAIGCALQSVDERGQALLSVALRVKETARDRFAHTTAAKTKIIEKLELVYGDLSRLNQFISEYELS